MDLHYEVHGTGEAIVLIHCGGTDLRNWQFIIPPLSQLYQVIAAAPNVEKMVMLTLTSPMYRVVMSSPQRDFLVEMMKHNTQRVLEWQTFDMIWPQPPASTRLSQLKTNTLLIIGKEDGEDLWRIAELFRQVPDIQFAYIEGADHLPTLTHPNEISCLITDFLNN